MSAFREETRHRRPRVTAAAAWCHRVWERARESWAAQVELHERIMLLEQPWKEDLLHWSHEGRLHGFLAPPAGRRRLSVTRTGWCPGCRPQAGRRRPIQEVGRP